MGDVEVFAEYRHVVRDHVYDKCWELDLTWAEVEDLLTQGEVVEKTDVDELRIKYVTLVWHDRPLHVVYIVDHERRVVIYRTIYRPDLAHWGVSVPSEEADMNCVMCDGTTTATTRPKAVERDGRIAVIRDVPVEVCDSCGEIYLDATVAKQLDVLFRQMLAGPVDEAVGHYIEAAA